ncbi:MAG TPA: hypothetical protein VIT67_10845 [Povalibacter sp.]|jgi:hypothetical protein
MRSLQSIAASAILLVLSAAATAEPERRNTVIHKSQRQHTAAEATARTPSAKKDTITPSSVPGERTNTTDVYRSSGPPRR